MHLTSTSFFFVLKVNGMPVTIGVGSVLSRDGFSFLLSPSSSETVWELLLSLGAIPLDADTWERLRVLRGHVY